MQNNTQPIIAFTKMEQYYEATFMLKLSKPCSPEETYWKNRVREFEDFDTKKYKN